MKELSNTQNDENQKELEEKLSFFVGPPSSFKPKLGKDTNYKRNSLVIDLWIELNRKALEITQKYVKKDVSYYPHNSLEESNIKNALFDFLGQDNLLFPSVDIGADDVVGTMFGNKCKTKNSYWDIQERRGNICTHTRGMSENNLNMCTEEIRNMVKAEVKLNKYAYLLDILQSAKTFDIRKGSDYSVCTDGEKQYSSNNFCFYDKENDYFMWNGYKEKFETMLPDNRMLGIYYEFQHSFTTLENGRLVIIPSEVEEGAYKPRHNAATQDEKYYTSATKQGVIIDGVYNVELQSLEVNIPDETDVHKIRTKPLCQKEMRISAIDGSPLNENVIEIICQKTNEYLADAKNYLSSNITQHKSVVSPNRVKRIQQHG